MRLLAGKVRCGQERDVPLEIHTREEKIRKAAKSAYGTIVTTFTLCYDYNSL